MNLNTAPYYQEKLEVRNLTMKVVYEMIHIHSGTFQASQGCLRSVQFLASQSTTKAKKN